MGNEFDMVQAIDTCPFIENTTSARIFELLRYGATLTTRQILSRLEIGRDRGDREYLFSLLKREVRWLYEVIASDGKVSKAQKTLNYTSRLRLRPKYRISQARWDKQVANTEFHHRTHGRWA